ncbi:MAG: prolipoprotein diacylglyceryl transferase [Opitutales bacterium]|nr:prolipoprotein diacylglyceryl transferase [Opitutales bacterium]
MIDPFWVHFPSGWGLEGIRWYGLFYVVNFFLLEFFLHRYAQRKISPLDTAQSDRLLFIFALGAVIGGRIGYCLFYNLDHFIQDPLIAFRVWAGGMASHGGFLGAILALFYFAWRYHCDVFWIADLFAATIPLCLGLGRLGNFINSELVGRVTEVPWGVIFPRVDPFVRHPSQLYEAFLEGFSLFIVLQILLYRQYSTTKLWVWRSGTISGIFLIGYALMRIIGEMFREPDAPLIFGMTRGQYYSLYLFLLGVVLLYLRRPKTSISPREP